MKERGRRGTSKKPEGLPYGISPSHRVSLFLECRVDDEGRIFADEATLTVLFSASFAGCLDSDDEFDDNDEGQCDGNEDVGVSPAAVDIVLVKSELKTEDDAQHLLADQDRWRAKVGNRSSQVTFMFRVVSFNT